MTVRARRLDGTAAVMPGVMASQVVASTFVSTAAAEAVLGEYAHT